MAATPLPMTVAQIRASRPQSLLDLSRRLGERRQSLVALGQRLLWQRSLARGWSGVASSAAADRYGLVVAGLGSLAASIATAADALARSATGMQAAIDLVSRADERAAAEGAWVDHDGQLFLPVRASLGDAVGEAHRARLDDLLREEVNACLAQACRAASGTDEQLLRALLSAARTTAQVGGGAPPDGMAGRVVPPPGTSGPGPAAQVFASAAWWRSLTNEEQRWVLRERPGWVGSRDGVPAAARHEANLILLDRAERVIRSDDGWTPNRGRSGSDVGQRMRQLQAVRAVRDVLSRRDGGDRRLLKIDTSGPYVRAVVALGDVDRAEHVVTFVGGLSTQVGGDLRRYDDTFVRLRGDARAVARGGDVAIVTWMGYDAPQWGEVLGGDDRSVLTATVARDNARALDDFVTGVEAARDRPAHQTVWAHSYGAVLAGFATLGTSAVDDVAVFGVPGLPFSDISQTTLKPGAFNVLGAYADPVFDYGHLVHGTSGGQVAGATRLSTLALKEPGTGCNHWLQSPSRYVDAGRTSSGHSDYLRAGTDSARNLVAVAAGRPDLRILQGADERACATRGPNLWPHPLGVPNLVP